MMIICAVVFVVCAFLLIQYFSNINRAKEATANLRELYAQGTAAPETTAAPSAQTTAEPEKTPTSSGNSAADSAPLATAAVSGEQSVIDPADIINADGMEGVASVATQPPVTSFSQHWPTQYAANPQLLIADSFQKLRQQNRDIVGWITIEEVLDEPVLQRDNAFYLTHDSTGEKNVTGALFLDENCNLRRLTPNLVIHGHNMKEGAMFGCLKKYKVKDASFYKSHPYITFNTLYEEARYVIFAVAEINIQPDAHYYLPFWRYLNFVSEDEFDNYIGMLRERSHFQTQVNVQPGDRLLTLATCTGTDEDTRLLVVARKIRENEDSITLSQGILSTQVK